MKYLPLTEQNNNNNNNNNNDDMNLSTTHNTAFLFMLRKVHMQSIIMFQQSLIALYLITLYEKSTPYRAEQQQQQRRHGFINYT